MLIRRPPRAASLLSLCAVAGLTAACADEPTGPAQGAPGDAPSLGVTATTDAATVTKSSASTVSRGDTAVTTIFLAPGTGSAAFDLKLNHKISFSRGASSVCDLATSSYGTTEWDKPCTPSTTTVKITAKVWHDAQGLAHTDFQPAMRFVPSDRVQLDMANKDGLLTRDMRIDFCTAAGCVDESVTDRSVATVGDEKFAKLSRRVKHFSGYMVSTGRR
jgi:hypothetical protein